MTDKPIAPDPSMIPVASKGDFTLTQKIIEQDTCVNLQSPRPDLDTMRAGYLFIALYQGDKLWTSNSPGEMRSQSYQFPKGITPYRTTRFLIGGLGIGVTLSTLQERLLRQSERQMREDYPVEKITVIEKYQEVIDIVGPTYQNTIPELEIICGDIWEFGKTGPKDYYDAAFIDIWRDLQGQDTLDEMGSIKRKLSRVMQPGGKRIVCWAEEQLRTALRTNRRFWM